MKRHQIKTWMAGIAIVTCGLAEAQIPLTVKTIDEESLLNGRAWRTVDAGTDAATGEPYITYGQPVCDMSKNAWGDRTYNGVSWTFNRFYFDRDLNYVRTEEKTFPSTIQAMDYAPIWGKKFIPMDGDMNIGAGAVGIVASMAGASASLGPIDKSFLGSTSVTVGMKGFTQIISRVKVYSQVISGAAMSSKPTAAQLNSCWESPMSTVLSSEPLKEEKGQKWVTVLSNPRPGGGHILYGTSGVYNEPGKAHYIFRNYDENAAIVGEELIVFDYLALVKGFVLETDQAVADYVLIATSLDYKKSEQKLAEPLSVEYIRVDGSTLKVKERFFFKAATTKWMVEKVIENSGNVYVMGPASSSTTERTTYTTYRVEDQVPNFQVAKISGGKADYVASFGDSDFTAALKSVPEVKGKVAPSLLLYQNEALKYFLKNGRLLITGQQYQAADKFGTFKAFGALVIASISSEGKLEAFYGLPESQISRGDLFFTKDTKTAYWATYDYKPLNDFSGASVVQKKYPFIASQLRLTKIDLDGAKILSTQICGAEEYAPVNGKEVMFDSETHVAINAKTLSKKAKDSDITLVMFEK